MRSTNSSKNRPSIHDHIRATTAFAAKLESWAAHLPPGVRLPATCVPALRQLGLALLAYQLNTDEHLRFVILDTMHDAMARVAHAAEAAGLPPMAAAA